MGTLTAHLLADGDHGRLRFHPDCPVCRRERLYGTLSSEPVVPRRLQAVVASGVLAVSTTAPAIAVAQEPDIRYEGVVAPEHPGADELDDPGFDPGGDTELPFDTTPAPAAPIGSEDTGDGAPLDTEPDVDLDARLAPLADTGAPVTDEQAPAPPVEGMPPSGGAAPGGVAPPPASGDAPAAPDLHAEAPAPPADEPSDAGDRRDRSPRTRGTGRALDRYAAEPHDAGAPVPTARVGGGTGAPMASLGEGGGSTPPSSPALPSTAADPVPVAEREEPTGPPARNASLAKGDSYVVQPGDSLWSIAQRLLGGQASAGRIAREVDRLWTLNRSRIATGNPDMLMVGTALALR